jgi:hypothetical protein
MVELEPDKFADELDKRGEIIWADELPGNNQN